MKYTVILYGTDSDGDCDVYQVHVESSACDAKGIIRAARLAAAIEFGDDENGDEEEEFDVDDWERFEGKNPIIFAGHLEEAKI